MQRLLVVLAALVLASSLPTGSARADSGGGGGGGGFGGGVDRASIDQKLAARRFERGQKHVEEAKQLEERLASEQDPDERKDLEEEIEDHYEDAVEDFEFVVKKQPDSYPALSDLGFSLRRLGRFEDSLRAYDRALRKKPGYGPAVEYRGESFLELGRLDDARRAWEQLSGTEPELADLLLGKMQRWLARQQTAEKASVDAENLAEFEKWLSERKLSDLPPRAVRAAASRW